MTSHSQPRGVGALQRWFFERVTGAADVTDAGEERAVLGGELPAQARVDIYRRAYAARLIECLADDYPAVAHVLGASAFEMTCRAFIASNPPPSASLNFYGAPFAAFCGAPGRLPEGGFVAELARLEWALVEVIHADAEMTLDPTKLAAATEDERPRLRLVPSPALRVLRCDYPVHRYYQQFVEHAAVGVPERVACGVAVCRRGDDVWRFGLEPVWLDLLERIRDGAPLESALGALEGAGDGEALQRTFSEWVSAGFFADVAMD